MEKEYVIGLLGQENKTPKNQGVQHVDQLYFCKIIEKPYICIIPNGNAQVAELVDALVSNTNEAIRAGSIPALGTLKIAGLFKARYFQ